MSRFLRRGFLEHRRLAELKRDLFRSTALAGDIFSTNLNRDNQLLLLLTPLIEVAWADGRITARETDAVLEIAHLYGISDDEDTFCILLESLIQRPSDTVAARSWLKIERLLTSLGAIESEIVCNAVLLQARYIAEQSSNNLIGFLRGDGLNSDEEKILRKIALEMKKVRSGQDSRIGDAIFVRRRGNQVRRNLMRPLGNGKASTVESQV